MKMIPYDVPLEKLGRPFETEVKPSKKFIKRVEKDLPDGNDISISLKLYNNLNEVVEYSDEFNAFGQDLSIEFLQKIYNKPINLINLTDNEVTCNSWAKLYAYFLNKHSIPCVIGGGGNHKSVYFKMDGFIFNADGTSITRDSLDNYSMDDLTRSRLGLRPSGFNALVVTEEGVMKVNVYDLGIDLSEEVRMDYVNLKDRVHSIIQNLKDCDSFKIRNLPDINDEIIDKFSLINNLIKGKELNGVSGVSYINTLIKILFSREEQKHMAYVYTKEKVGNEYKTREVINYGIQRKHKHDYTLGIPDLDGYNFAFNGDSLEYLTKRKARHMIEDSHSIDIDSVRRK